MKRAAIIITLAFAIGLIMSSCTKEACPAYSQAESDQIEDLG